MGLINKIESVLLHNLLKSSFNRLHKYYRYYFISSCSYVICHSSKFFVGKFFYSRFNFIQVPFVATKLCIFLKVSPVVVLQLCFFSFSSNTMWLVKMLRLSHSRTFIDTDSKVSYGFDSNLIQTKNTRTLVTLEH